MIPNDPFLEPIAKSKGKVGDGYSVEVTIWRYGMQSSWTPDIPNGMSPKQWDRYRRIRNKAIRKACSELGLESCLVIEA